MVISMEFRWNTEKNEELKAQRGLSFERVVIAIQEGYLLDVREHPNQGRYPNQILLIVNIEQYAICVPCVPDKSGSMFMKTLFPSRRYTRELGLEVEDD